VVDVNRRRWGYSRGCRWWVDSETSFAVGGGGLARGLEVVVAETVVSPREVALESLSYTASEVVGGAGWVEPRAQGWPKADE
jgi:hypothetical protein